MSIFFILAIKKVFAFSTYFLVLSTLFHLAVGAYFVYYNTTTGKKEYHQVQTVNPSSQGGYVEVTLLKSKETTTLPQTDTKTFNTVQGTLSLVMPMNSNGKVYFQASYDTAAQKLVYTSNSEGMASSGWVKVAAQTWNQYTATKFSNALDSIHYSVYIQTTAYNSGNPYDQYMIIGVDDPTNGQWGHVGGSLEAWARPKTNTTTWEYDGAIGHLTQVDDSQTVASASGPDVTTAVWKDTSNATVSNGTFTPPTTGTGGTTGTTGTGGTTGGTTGTGGTTSGTWSGLSDAIGLTDGGQITGMADKVYDSAVEAPVKKDISSLLGNLVTNSPLMRIGRTLRVDVSNGSCEIGTANYEGHQVKFDMCRHETFLSILGGLMLAVSHAVAVYVVIAGGKSEE